MNIIPIDNISYNDASQQPDSDKELMELVHHLPLGYKTVFNLYAIEGYSHEEIGKCSTSNLPHHGHSWQERESC